MAAMAHIPALGNTRRLSILQSEHNVRWFTVLRADALPSWPWLARACLYTGAFYTAPPSNSGGLLRRIASVPDISE